MMTGSLPTQEREQFVAVATLVRSALTDIGLCYRHKDGGLQEITFSRLGITADRARLVLEVDMLRLPPRVTVTKLTSNNTTHHLTAVIGKPVHRLNTTGLTYSVEMDHVAQHDRPLPDVVPLDLRRRPKGRSVNGQPLYLFALGHNHTQGDLYLSLRDTSHILVGGESRSGKSTWINAVLASLLPFYAPHELNVAFVDPKGVEFNLWDGIAHQIAPIAEEPEEALAIANALVQVMQGRRGIFKEVKARNLSTCNARRKAEGLPPLPLILFVVDELTDLTEQDRRLYTPLIRLACKGAAFGVLLLVATQNPRFDVVPTVIRGNLSTRIGFRVASAEHSRTILGSNVDGRGCHQLPRNKRGRLMLRYDNNLVEFQGFLIADSLIDRIADHLRGLKIRAEPLLLKPPTSGEEDGIVEPESIADAAVAYPEGELSILTEAEWEALRVAVDELDGDLAVNRLYEELGGQLAKNAINDLGQRLQDAGWLLSGSGNRPRTCTDALIEQVALHYGE
jgi:DNA segregation ATPase FtsK/SpoIIIE-like protein